MSTSTDWQPIDPARARSLSDARLQFHHAAQFATAVGISYLDHQPDDSHTNLGWRHDLRALVSRAAPGPHGPVAIGIRPHDLSVLVLVDDAVRESFALHGLTMRAAVDRLTSLLAAAGLDGSRYTQRRHYEIPPHPVGEGRAFDASATGDFEQLSRWYANAATLLARIAADVPGASDVRTWPHHFDIATLVTVAPGRTTGAGLSPGDTYYDEPYFYVNAHPAPSIDRLTSQLGGGGSWHTHEWIGAVLPGSRLRAAAHGQPAQAREFVESALAAGRVLVLG